MKNFTAPKLLSLALTGIHMSYCPYKNDSILECICWKHEVKKWHDRNKLASAARVRKPKSHRTHLMNHICSARVKGSTVSFSNDVKDVTCQQCIKFANKPIPLPKVSKKQLKMNSSSSIYSTTTT